MGRYPSDDPTLRNPTSGMFGCCARAARGHAVAVPTNAMNSRRLMASPTPRTTSGMQRIALFGLRIVPLVTSKGAVPMSALGQKRTFCDAAKNVVIRSPRRTNAQCGVGLRLTPRIVGIEAHDVSGKVVAS